MFKSSYECPLGKDQKKETTCDGCREGGILKNYCAAQCDAYKNHVKKDTH